MLRFCGFDLELQVEDVLPTEAKGHWPVVHSARDEGGSSWLIVQVDDDPLHPTRLCAPISERALQTVVEGRRAPADALRHSSTGTAGLVAVDHVRAVPDRCLPGGQVAEMLSAVSSRPALVSA
jgi:hypothetical protein